MSLTSATAGIPVHDEQGTRDRPYDLTVGFDPAKIDAALRALGREPWSAALWPRLVALLGVRIGATSYVLASDGERGRDQRGTQSCGRTIRHADRAPRSGGPGRRGFERPRTGARRSFEPRCDIKKIGDIALVGGMVWSEETLGWVADWHLAAPGRAYRWQIRGVGFDEAFRNAMAGAAQVLSGHGPPG